MHQRPPEPRERTQSRRLDVCARAARECCQGVVLADAPRGASAAAKHARHSDVTAVDSQRAPRRPGDARSVFLAAAGGADRRPGPGSGCQTGCRPVGCLQENEGHSHLLFG